MREVQDAVLGQAEAGSGEEGEMILYSTEAAAKLASWMLGRMTGDMCWAVPSGRSWIIVRLDASGKEVQ